MWFNSFYHKVHQGRHKVYNILVPLVKPLCTLWQKIKHPKSMLDLVNQNKLCFGSFWRHFDLIICQYQHIITYRAKPFSSI